MKAQTSEFTEEIYVCTNSNCQHKFTKATEGYQLLKIGGTVLTGVLALVGFGHWLSNDG